MSKWTDQLPEAAREYIGGRRVDEVECVIGDIAGVARGKAMPATKFAKQTNYFLPNSIFLQTGLIMLRFPQLLLLPWH